MNAEHFVACPHCGRGIAVGSEEAQKEFAQKIKAHFRRPVMRHGLTALDILENYERGELDMARMEAAERIARAKGLIK